MTESLVLIIGCLIVFAVALGLTVRLERREARQTIASHRARADAAEELLPFPPGERLP
jgi:hypothetical protein